MALTNRRDPADTATRLARWLSGLFTVECGELWLLQSRAAKRSPGAAVRLAVALQRDGVITESEALHRVTPQQVEALLRPRIDPEALADAKVLATGKPASPTTDPDGVPAMSVARAVITELGGSTSHAAVVSREIGVPYVVGCGSGSVTSLGGRTATVDGATGTVYEGALPIVAPADDDPELAVLTQWARAEGGDPDGDAPLAGLLRARANRDHG